LQFYPFSVPFPLKTFYRYRLTPLWGRVNKCGVFILWLLSWESGDGGGVTKIYVVDEGLVRDMLTGGGFFAF